MLKHSRRYQLIYTRKLILKIAPSTFYKYNHQFLYTHELIQRILLLIGLSIGYYQLIYTLELTQVEQRANPPNTYYQFSHTLELILKRNTKTNKIYKTINSRIRSN